VIYLDHNATTPVLPEVFEAMKQFFTESWGNPSSSYRFGSELKGAIEVARGQVAELIGARASEIVFTGNATESNNAAIHAALRANPKRRHIVTSQVEHSSVLNYCMAMEKEGYRVTYLPVDREGLLKIADLENAITDETAIVSLMWANNETGVLFQVTEIARLCKARGVLYHCDAVQAAGKLAVDVSQVPADYLSITGHKFGAPKGVGALYIHRKAPFSPLLCGGHQERGRRGGTENVAQIVGLGVAAQMAKKRLSGFDSKVRAFRDELEIAILCSVPETELNGHKTHRTANTTNLTFRGVESEALLLLLDQAGICASSGSACLADSEEPSHVVKAMKPDTTASRQMVRFSLSAANTRKEIESVVATLKQSVAALRG